MCITQKFVFIFIFSPVEELGFSVSDFGDCSERCGVGQQTRTVTCTRTLRSMVGVAVLLLEDEECLGPGIARPSDTQICNTFSCPEYVVGDFGPVIFF